MPRLQLVSRPVELGEQRAPSGLWIENAAADDLLTVVINEIGVTLAATAWVQAQAGQAVEIGPVRGSVLVETATGSSTAVARKLAQSEAVASHLAVDVTVPAPCHTESVNAPDGAFVVEDAQLTIIHNTLRFKLDFMLFWESVRATYSCGAPPVTNEFAYAWSAFFTLLHWDLWQQSGSYLVDAEQWRLRGGEVFAEAIFTDRASPVGDGEVHSTSCLILRHAPTK